MYGEMHKWKDEQTSQRMSKLSIFPRATVLLGNSWEVLNIQTPYCIMPTGQGITSEHLPLEKVT